MSLQSERLALAALFTILVGLPIAVLGYQYGLRPLLAGVRTVDIIAAVPEAGGFRPDRIEVQKGETVRLRFSVPDVTHGVAVAGLGLDLGHIDPGQVKEIEVVFDEPGQVTFYCNTWCSPNHWRMRGTITIIDSSDPYAHLRAGSAPDPVIESLVERGIDIDAPHEAPLTPAAPLSTLNGQTLLLAHRANLPADLFDHRWLQQHSPAEAHMLLQQTVPDLTDSQRWDLLAYLWTNNVTHAELEWAQTQYAKNCAACHGETGRGDGPAAAAINAQLADSAMHHNRVSSFAPAPSTLGATTEIYYAKLRRGGMGTSMPGFGTIFNEEETWRLARYIWQLTLISEDGAAAE